MKGGDKSAVAIVKDVRQLGCVSQDVEPPESSAILRKGTKVSGPIRRVRFTRAALRQANIRENKGPSLGKMKVKVPHQRSLYVVKIEESSQEESERQERCARGDAWKLAKNIYKLKETEKATFHSPSDEWVLPAAFALKPEEQEFVVDSGASMYIICRKDFNSAELETVRASKCPTTVVTANCEVLTKEEATVYDRELDLFGTVMLLEDTPAVLSLGKLCEDHGYAHGWPTGQKPQTIKGGRRSKCSTANLGICMCGVSVCTGVYECPCLCLSVCLSVCLFVSCRCCCLVAFVYVHVFTMLNLPVVVCRCVCIFVCICRSVSMSMCVSTMVRVGRVGLRVIVVAVVVCCCCVSCQENMMCLFMHSSCVCICV